MNAIKRPFTVIVEGNIGCGKTRFLNHFKRYDNISICPEPVKDWQNCNGHNLLKYLYKDIKKWSFTFQSYVQLTMLQQHSMHTDKPIKLMERSIYSARYCFVENMVKDELMPTQSMNVLDKWFQWIIKNNNADVDLIVYIRTNPEVVYNRIMERGRLEEKMIPFQYIQDLHDIHEKWLYHKTLHKCPAPVLIMDGNLDKSKIGLEYEKVEPKIFSASY